MCWLKRALREILAMKATDLLPACPSHSPLPAPLLPYTLINCVSFITQQAGPFINCLCIYLIKPQRQIQSKIFEICERLKIKSKNAAHKTETETETVSARGVGGRGVESIGGNVGSALGRVESRASRQVAS